MLLAIDAGTTGVKAIAVSEQGNLLGSSYLPLRLHYPRPGWVEQDPEEIWSAVLGTIAELRRRHPGTVAAVGLSNQRETVVAWDRLTDQVLGRAIVWQDRRTTATCRHLQDAGHTEFVRATTGLVIDPYFSATKMSWMLREQIGEPPAGLVLSTVDAWLAYRLTGGLAGGVVVTDATNASRTLCFDTGRMAWSEELCQVFGVPERLLAQVVPTAGRVGRLAGGIGPDLQGTPLSALVGDQQAALFGQACVRPGMAKCTFGTGTFVLAQVGSQAPAPPEGLLSTVAWDLGGRGGVAYALEGAIFCSGATIDWLASGLGVIAAAPEVGPLAATSAHTAGLHIVPAFTGLGSPWWDPRARGAVVGLARGVGRPQLALVALESIAYQVRDVVEAMDAASDFPLQVLRVDGGASAADLLCQIQADQLGVPVVRAAESESTALGAALLAGLAEGVWADLDEVAACWRSSATFERRISRAGADSRQADWRRAVDRSRQWALDDESSEV